jgi:hypothetical protein
MYDNEQLKELIKLYVIKVMAVARDTYEKLKQTSSTLSDTLPTKLWIEKQGNNEKETSYQYGNQSIGDDKITDFIEDTIDATNEKFFKKSRDNMFPFMLRPDQKYLAQSISASKIDFHEESEYLIFERHFESQSFSSTTEEEEKDPEATNPSIIAEKDPIEDDLNTEDLGIIDIEDDDVFDNIDDDKLPFLKNTYSKKNRPNNSKSVAAGSKSKANRIDFGREDVGPEVNTQLAFKEKNEQDNENNAKPETEPSNIEIVRENFKTTTEVVQSFDENARLPTEDLPQDLGTNNEKINKSSRNERLEHPKPLTKTENISEVFDYDPFGSQKLTVADPKPVKNDKQISSMTDFKQKYAEPEEDLEESEGEDDINNYIDFEDDGESDSEDPYEFKKFPEKNESTRVELKKAKEVKREKNVLENIEHESLMIEDFDECTKNSVQEVRKTADIPYDKNINDRNEKLEENKIPSKHIISMKKLTPIKNKTKNVNISINNPDITIKTSMPHIHTSKISGARLNTKKLGSSRSTILQQPHSSPKALGEVISDSIEIDNVVIDFDETVTRKTD